MYLVLLFHNFSKRFFTFLRCLFIYLFLFIKTSYDRSIENYKNKSGILSFSNFYNVKKDDIVRFKKYFCVSDLVIFIYNFIW